MGDTEALIGLTVLLTREPRDNEELAKRIRSLGGLVVESPLIQILQRPDALLGHIGKVSATTEMGVTHWFNRFDALVVTSANALCSLRDVLVRFPSLTSVLPCYVVGARSSQEAQTLGLRTIHPPGVRTAHFLAEYLIEYPDRGAAAFHQLQAVPRRLLWLRGNLADLSFKHRLEEAGLVVEDVVCYDTAVLSMSGVAWEEVRAGGGVVVLYSPSAVSAYLKSPVVQAHPPEGDLHVIAIGPTTAKALADAGVRGVVMAPEPRLEGVIDTLLKINQRRDSHESTR